MRKSQKRVKLLNTPKASKDKQKKIKTLIKALAQEVGSEPAASFRISRKTAASSASGTTSLAKRPVTSHH